MSKLDANLVTNGQRQATSSARYVFGTYVTIQETVNGDVIAAPISGDALMAGSTMTLQRTGHVGRDALLAGATMDLQGPVARNVQALATD